MKKISELGWLSKCSHTTVHLCNLIYTYGDRSQYNTIQYNCVYNPFNKYTSKCFTVSRLRLPKESGRGTLEERNLEKNQIRLSIKGFSSLTRRK
jgi:hypothetical protein